MSDPRNPSTKSPTWSRETAIHQGRRDYQEDTLDSWSNADFTGILVVLADGAGGHGGGGEASAAAVTEAGRRLREIDGVEDAGRFLEEWMLAAHEAVKRSGKGGARTAAVAMLAKGRQVEWVHAGDCRLYHFRGGERLLRTRDDSVVQVLFEQGEISEWEMGRHEDQNRLLQAIGGEDPPKPRRGSAEAGPGDVFLLCSDGFWENLEAEELARLTLVPPRKRGRALRRAVSLAVERGGSKADNTSAVLAVYGEGLGAAPRSRFPGWALGVVVATILIILMALWKLSPPVQDWVARRGWVSHVAGETVREEPSAPDEETPVVPPKP